MIFERCKNSWVTLMSERLYSLGRTVQGEQLPPTGECGQEAQRELIMLLRSIPAEEFGRDRGLRSNGYRVIIARILQAELEDERAHHRQIAEFGGWVVSIA